MSEPERLPLADAEAHEELYELLAEGIVVRQADDPDVLEEAA